MWRIPDDDFQLDIEVDEEKASPSGVSNASIESSLDSYFTELELTSFREGEHKIPLYLRLKLKNATTCPDSMLHSMKATTARFPWDWSQPNTASVV